MEIRKIFVALAMVFISNTVLADSFDDGVVAFISGDGAEAYRIWKPLADKGNPEAQYHLGYMFQTGTGVDKDKSQALFWYNKAAENGHGKAFILAKVVQRELKN
jgi:hypothetical protein